MSGHSPLQSSIKNTEESHRARSLVDPITPKQAGMLWLKGVLMGAADVVPGISGGTMALITGIYDRLIGAIAAVTPANTGLLLRGRFKVFWQRIDGYFLLVLLAGIVSAFVFLAGAIRWLLAHHPLPTWSFFFGLILGSAILIMRQTRTKSPTQWLWLLPGFVTGWWISGLTPLHVDPSLPMVFFAGMLAIMAMILPGISGSFILLLLGMYTVLLTAVDERQWPVLALFAAGASLGLLAFSHALKWLLARYHDQTLRLLCGLMLGSLKKIWPWHAITGPAAEKIWPWQLPVDQALSSMAAGVTALALVFLFHHLGARHADRQAKGGLS